MSSHNITKTIGANNLQIYYNKGKKFIKFTCYSKEPPRCIEGEVTLDVDGVKELKSELDNFLRLISFDEKVAQYKKDGKR